MDTNSFGEPTPPPDFGYRTPKRNWLFRRSAPYPETDLTVDAVDEAVQRFVQAGGGVVADPFDIQIGRCAVVADPWGNHLVLLDNSKGSFVTDANGNVTGVHRGGIA